MSSHTPILFITFNRPDHTRRVFDVIRQQRPGVLYIFQDAPREKNLSDVEKCKEVRAIFEKGIDWECNLQTYYAKSNLGCGKGPATAISWFFEQLEQGIILEDDCLPHTDFFPYCEELLEKYKYNESVFFIAGSSFQPQSKKYEESYYFGCGAYATWGWATWKRSWANFDYYLQDIDNKSVRKIIDKYFRESRQKSFWMEVYEILKTDRYNESCWDYQFYFSCWKKNMLAVVPNTNLISNIGYDQFATHTFSSSHPAANILTKSIYPLSHPEEIKLNYKADFYVHCHYIRNHEYGWKGIRTTLLRINKWIKRMFGYQGSWIKKSK